MNYKVTSPMIFIYLSVPTNIDYNDRYYIMIRLRCLDSVTLSRMVHNVDKKGWVGIATTLV